MQDRVSTLPLNVACRTLPSRIPLSPAHTHLHPSCPASAYEAATVSRYPSVVVPSVVDQAVVGQVRGRLDAALLVESDCASDYVRDSSR